MRTWGKLLRSVNDFRFHAEPQRGDSGGGHEDDVDVRVLDTGGGIEVELPVEVPIGRCLDDGLGGVGQRGYVDGVVPVGILNGRVSIASFSSLVIFLMVSADEW
jgi:hypothetical protein